MSWVEVEAKVHVSDVKDVRKKIRKIAKFSGMENKIDDYYSLERRHYPKKSLRVRRKGKKVEVNYKERLSYKNNVWAKKEVEFEVSDLNNFFDLLENFGFRKWLRKEKRTELYKTKDGINIELNYVKKLGWFVEVEALCPKKDIEKYRKRVSEIREKLEVKNINIRKDGYTKALWKLKHKK